MWNLCWGTEHLPAQLLWKVGPSRCKQHFVPAEPGWNCTVIIGPKVFTPLNRGPKAPWKCPYTVLRKKQKFNVVMTCQFIQPRMLCETRNWITHPLGELSVFLESCQGEPSSKRDSTPGLTIPGFKASELQGSKPCTQRKSSRVSPSLTQACTGSLRAHNISKTQLSLDFQVNSRGLQPRGLRGPSSA